METKQETERIAGQCENCGFAYKGVVKTNDGAFPEIECPKCHEETQNFDYETDVQERDKEEDYQLDYVESTFKSI